MALIKFFHKWNLFPKPNGNIVSKINKISYETRGAARLIIIVRKFAPCCQNLGLIYEIELSLRYESDRVDDLAEDKLIKQSEVGALRVCN